MQESSKIKVGISAGDYNGIGIEVALKTFADARMLELCTPVVFASTKMMSAHQNAVGTEIKFHGIAAASDALEGKFNVVNTWKDQSELQWGIPTEDSGKKAIESLVAAVAALKQGDIDVLVTAPIDKSNVQSASFSFPGHTDYLAQELGGKSLMFMVSDTLRVGLLTDHLPVKEVSKAITPQMIREKVALMMDSLVKDFGIRKPKIALLGINPHNGDKGVIGSEDDEVLKPTIQEIAAKGHLVYGPYAADGFFGSGTYRQFDAVLAAYHDQGLIPFKTLSFGQGVNFTAGLSHVRTSPDHGTAFDIAGSGRADHSSFHAAVYEAINIYRLRKDYLFWSKNPLKKAVLQDKKPSKKPKPAPQPE
ncbi:MAG: 4-hydroxythreonine-4-phosphate dehydrogenase PdxA [Flavobacteriaceae bacterium]|jgi:4-hydroxythreonine-4-phosphate dehydrogenase|nr:4-hydroxythreonine-4-phosphate dehydrogenase PdxA [Flavobacteriaceae bacterium]MDP4674411.1 4-hydroxythreonine-4-phosphate dehydrogenase PdxA [Flavobacteriaceae bacterium]MDP4754312.1 4-hydroxythreonine-4-phosphate dehydrogenase PdxA [Flavobacteriaceae bacterium]MDP4794290.1 4-hydroxythreonine-4-phosphate dehydrogenase PdxA [Flavobacteriaceae bacterium]MDP4885750.1 4-hydroxythreonine-4-phosphate dehydrogenase PdxA [Flavobacteriaceae bacterium]